MSPDNETSTIKAEPVSEDDPRIQALVSELESALEKLRQGRDVDVGGSAELPLAPLARCLVALGCDLRDLADAVDEAAGRTPKKPSPRPLSHEALRCSFCDKSQSEVGKLIAGPFVFICDVCVTRCLGELVDDSAADPRPLAERIEKSSDAEALRCSFCFKSRWEVGELVGGAGQEDFICDWCLYGSRDALGSDVHPAAIGGYRLLAKLEGHATGAVWSASHRKHARRAYVKRLIPPCARFLCLDDEEAASHLSHPSIANVYAILRGVEDHDWIVSEPVEGKTLKRKLSDNWLGRRELLDVAAVVRLGREVAEGLAAAHGAGILHRHLTTENVMIALHGRARILDFGLGMRAGRTAASLPTGLSALQSLAPEQFTGEPLDPRTDLFALGTMLFEATTGKSPFHDGSRFMEPYEVMLRVCKAPHPRIRPQNPGLPGKLEELIDRLLAKHADERPKDAGEVVRELRRIEREL